MIELIKNKISNPSILIIGGIIFVLTAYFSAGFFYADEHFQILEFASHKVNPSNNVSLAWEYSSQIRPGFMPFIAYLWIKGLNMIGVTDRYFIAFIIRLFGSLFVFGSILSLIKLWTFEEKAKTKIALILSLFLFYVPFLAARFTGEIFGGALFCLGFSLIEQHRRREKNFPVILLSGILLGLSFQARYQLAILIICYGVILIQSNFKAFNWIPLILGGLISLIVGFLADYWLYDGVWIFPAIKYFVVNLLEGKANEFGVQPFYWFLQEYIIQSNPLISLPLIGIVGYLIYLKKISKEIILVLVFFIVHCFISHKEIRFLFPVLFLLPKIVLDFLYTPLYQKYSTKKILLNYLSFALIVNLLLLGRNTILSANTQFDFNTYYHNHIGEKTEKYIFFPSEATESVFGGYFKDFYGHPKYKAIFANPASEMFEDQLIEKCDYIYCMDLNDLNTYKGYGKLLYSNPNPIFLKFDFNNWVSRSPQYYLIEVNKTK